MARRARLATLLTCLAAFGAATSARATTYYVAPGGDDTAAGTSPAGAWRTPSRVSGTDLAPGDHVLFAGGATFTGELNLGVEDAGTEARPVVIGSYGGGRATLAAGDHPGLYAQDAGGLVIRDLRFRGPGMDASAHAGVAIYASGPAGARFPRVGVERVEATGFGRTGVLIGSWAGSAGFDGIDIADTDAHANALGGIATFAQQRAAHRSVTVVRSRAWNNPGRAGLTGNSGNGIVVGGANGALVEGCVAHHNGGRDTAYEGGVGIWAYDSHGVVIQHNRSYENRTGGPADGGGFDLDGGVSGSVIQYNHSHDNDGAGFLVASPPGHERNRENVVRFNLSERDGRRNGYPGVFVWRAVAALSVHHNTVVGPGPAVRSSELGEGSAALRNNLFMRTGTGTVVTVEPDSTRTTFQGNAYWTPGGAPAFDWAGGRYHGLGAWRAASGQERVGAARTGLDGDPLLVARPGTASGAAAYAPAAGSPLIDAALALAPFGLEHGGRDLLGTPAPVGAGPDVGAIESPLAAAAAGRGPGTAPVPLSPAGATAGVPAPAPAAARRALRSPRLRIDRVERRGRRVAVRGRAARTLPAGARVRVRVRPRRGGRAGRAVFVRVRRGRFRAVVARPARLARRAGRVEVAYRGDARHHAQRSSARVPR